MCERPPGGAMIFCAVRRATWSSAWEPVGEAEAVWVVEPTLSTPAQPFGAHPQHPAQCPVCAHPTG